MNGAAIAQVRPGSPADDAGLQPGDVIMEVNRKPTTSADQVASNIRSVPNGKERAAAGVVERWRKLPRGDTEPGLSAAPLKNLFKQKGLAVCKPLCLGLPPHCLALNCQGSNVVL